MTALAWLIPSALALGALGLVAFLWCLRTGQYDDLEGAAWRALDDGDGRPDATPIPLAKNVGTPAAASPATSPAPLHLGASRVGGP